MDSIWKSSTQMPEFPALKSNKKTDVLIIGGGITGLLCAHFLQERGVEYILAEAGKICSGVTQNTTAKITAQHGLIYNKILKSRGLEAAAMYLHANLAAVEKYGELCAEIDCDFERKTSYVYSVDSLKKLEKEADALAKIGFYSEITDSTELPFSVAGAISFNNQAQFNPLEFLSHISKDLKIFENTRIAEFIPAEGNA